MNILIVGQNTKLAALLQNISDELYMVVDTSIPNYRPYNENNSFNILYTNTDINKTSSIIIRKKEIYEWIKRYDINIVFTNDKISMVAAKLASYKCRDKVILLSTSHNSYAWANHLKVSVFSKLINWATDGYVCLASFVYNQLLKNNISSHKLLLQPNVIECGLFTQKDSYDIVDGVIKIVYTSTVYEGKAQSDLIKAAKILKDRNIKFHIDFWGNTISSGESYFEYCNKLIREFDLSDNIVFNGLIDNSDLRKLLPLYDIYVCPSHMEMSPFNILEAKATGLPIIATNVGGIPDLIEDNSDGILVEPSNPDILAAEIANIINDDKRRSTMGRNARSRAEETSKNTPQTYLSFINSLRYAKTLSN